MELIRFGKNSDIIDVGNFEVGIIVSRLPCLRNWAHCYPGRVATVPPFITARLG